LKIHVIALTLLDGDQIVNLAQNIAATIPASEVSVRVIGEVLFCMSNFYFAMLTTK
jgi:hypothetical protein